MSRIRIMLTIGAAFMLVALLAPAGLAQDEEPRLNLQFQGENLGQILQLLSRGYGLQYTLGEGVDANMSITTSLIGVTVDQALRSMLEPNGLIAVNQDGRYIIRERPQPTEREGGPTTVTPVAATGTRPTPPAPTRATTYTPGAGTAPAGGRGETDEEEEQILEVIWPKYIGAAMASAIFGGGMIDAGAAIGGMGGGYGGGSSRYGGSSYGGSSYGGSSFGRSGGSSFGGSSFGRSSRGSSLGSSRGSSFGSNY